MTVLSLMHHFYATISHIKVKYIVHIVLPVETNLVIQMIRDHQLLRALKINCSLIVPFLMQKNDHGSWHATSMISFWPRQCIKHITYE